MERTTRIESARYAVLADLARTIPAVPDSQRLAKEVAQKLRSALGFDRCTIALLISEGDSFSHEALFDIRDPQAGSGYAVFPLKDDLISSVIRLGETRLIDVADVPGDRLSSEPDPQMWDGSIHTVICLPLWSPGKVLGALCFGAHPPNAYGKAEVAFLEAVAGQLALGVGRRQLNLQLQRAKEELGHLSTFPEFNPAAIIELDAVGLVYYMNPAAEETFPDWRRYPLNSPLLADLPPLIDVLRAAGKRVELREVKMGDNWYQQVYHLVPNSERFRSYVIDISDRKRAEEALQRQNEYLAALHATTLGMLSRLDLNDLLQSVVSRAGQLLGAVDGFVFHVEPGDDRIEMKVGVGQFENEVGRRLERGEGVSGRVWETGEPVVVNNYDEWERRTDYIAPKVLDAVAAVPLRSGDQVVGTLGLAYRAASNKRFGDAEIAFLSRFAELASLALDNARLFAKTQEHARLFQEQAERLSLLNELARQMSLAGTIEEAVSVGAALGPRIIPCDRAAVALLSEAGDGLEVIALEGEVGSLPVGARLPLEGSLAGRAMREKRVVTVDDIQDGRTEVDAVHLAEQGLRSVMTAPMMIGDRALGILRIGIGKAGVYTQREESLLMQMASFLGTTIENRRLFRDAEAARASAVAANEAKSAFLANMSHEIRTPMNAIIGMTNLLADTELDADQREYVDTVHQSGESLLSIINDILDFSKIEAHRLDLENRPFNLRECIEASLDVLAPSAAQKGLDLAYLIEPGVPEGILGDVTRLRQIVVNLLSNAVKFTEHGEVVLTVSLEAKAHDEQRAGSPPGEIQLLHFAVRDTGIGIPRIRMNRLFQSFSQVDASTSRRYGGTGLGLAISKRLAEMMGGTMWAESTLGMGSTFHFTIKAASADVPAQTHPENLEFALKGKRLLIVDDNATNRLILSRQAQTWQMRPEESPTPLDALDRLRGGESFDVAVLDMHMPEMDGVTLAREIRALGTEQSRLPLVMLTSLGRGDDRDGAEHFAAFLTKPVKPSALFNALAGVFVGTSAPSSPVQRSEAGQIDARMAEKLPLRILLAEDNLTNQKLALRLLGRMGYQADVVGNGQEVLTAMADNRYDVVLMDVQMPEMDGLEATRRIRADFPIDRQPHVIAMTANAMQGDREKCLAAGMNDYVSKPIRVDDLVEALRKARPVVEPAPGAQDSPSVPQHAETATPREVVFAPPRDVAEPATLDPAALSNLLSAVGGEFSFLEELIDSFLEDAPKLLADLRQYVAQGDAEGTRRVAHGLKSNGADLGATDFSRLCRELEMLARSGSTEGAHDLFARIEAEYPRVRAALEAIRRAQQIPTSGLSS